MSSGALALPVAWERRFFAFVRQEWAASPSRWHATIRTTLATLLSIALIMTLQIPEGEFLIVTIFVVSQSDSWASLYKAMLRVAGTVAGGALGIFAIAAFADRSSFLMTFQALVIGFSIFFNRTSRAPYAFLMTAFTYVLVAPDFISTPDYPLERALWRFALTALGAVLGTGVQLILWPDHPETLLLTDLGARLESVARMLDRVLVPPAPPARPHAPTNPVEATGMARQLDLLAGAESLSPRLRQRHAEQVKLIIDVQRIVTAALRLERSGVDASRLSPALIDRTRRVRDRCRALSRVLASRRPASVAAGEVPTTAEPRRADPALAPVAAALEEMEESLARLPEVISFARRPAGAGAAARRAPLAENRLFTPACSLANTEAVHGAVKAALGVSICGVLYSAFDQPNLSTALISCLVVAQATVGASRRKGLLRGAGAFLGAAGAAAAIAIVIPNIDSLAPFLVVCTLLFGIAAWIVSGTGQTSYIGLQMAIALSLVLINDLGPSVDFSPALYRVLGVFLGAGVMWAIDVALWPVFAQVALPQKLGEAVAHMAELQRSSAAWGTSIVHDQAVFTYRTLAEALALHDDLRLEPEWEDEHAQRRERVLRLTSAVQAAFLQLLGAHRHRPAAAALPPSAIAALSALDDEVAAHLDLVARALRRGEPVEVELPSGAALLDALLAEPPTAAIQEWALLYRQLLAALKRLDAAVTGLAIAAPPSPVASTSDASPPVPA